MKKKAAPFEGRPILHKNAIINDKV